VTLGFVLAMLVVLGPAPDDGPASFNHAARYGFCFLLGVVSYHFRDRIPVSPWLVILSAALAYMCAETRFEGAAYMIMAGHLVLVAGARDYGVLTSFCRKTDLSYGVYIYGLACSAIAGRACPRHRGDKPDGAGARDRADSRSGNRGIGSRSRRYGSRGWRRDGCCRALGSPPDRARPQPGSGD